MPLTWEVEFLEEFYQTSEKYMARYDAPSKKSASDPASLPADWSRFQREGEQLRDSLIQANRLKHKQLDLNACKRGLLLYSRDLGVGPWIITVVIRRNPSRGMVLPMFHREDVTDEELKVLIEEAQERFKEIPPKRKNDQT